MAKKLQKAKFGTPAVKTQSSKPGMSTTDVIGQVFQGKMTAAQGHAALGYKPKPAMTPAQNAEFLAKVKAYGKKKGGPMSRSTYKTGGSVKKKK
jgi:hypothetical protein